MPGAGSLLECPEAGTKPGFPRICPPLPCARPTQEGSGSCRELWGLSGHMRVCVWVHSRRDQEPSTEMMCPQAAFVRCHLVASLKCTYNTQF